MDKGEKRVIVGCSGSGGQVAMMAKKLMPEIDVTVIRKEEFFNLPLISVWRSSNSA